MSYEEDRGFNAFLETKKKESGGRYPFISDAEMNGFIEEDSIYIEMARRMGELNKLIGGDKAN